MIIGSQKKADNNRSQPTLATSSPAVSTSSSPNAPILQESDIFKSPEGHWSIVKLKLTWTSSGGAFKEVYFFETYRDKVAVPIPESSNGNFEKVLDPPLRAMEVRLIPKKGANNGTATVELELADTGVGPLRHSFPVGQPVYFKYPNVNAK